MNIDDIIQLAGDEAAVDVPSGRSPTPSPTSRHDRAAVDVPSGPDIETKREKLAAGVVGGKAERWLGRVMSLEQVDKLTNSEVEKYYARYQMGLDAAMSSTLGQSVLTMHSDLVAQYEPELDRGSLISELEANPIVELGLSSAAGKMYYMFSNYLAPLVGALITFKHVRLAQMRRLEREETHVGVEGEEPTES